VSVFIGVTVRALHASALYYVILKKDLTKTIEVKAV